METPPIVTDPTGEQEEPAAQPAQPAAPALPWEAEPAAPAEPVASAGGRPLYPDEFEEPEVPEEPEEPEELAPPARYTRPARPARPKWLTAGGAWNAFKTFAILFSFTINFVVLIALLLIVPQLPRIYAPLRNELLGPVVGGLYSGFGELNNATIEREIAVHDTVPAVFPISLDQSTTVELVEPVPLELPATFSLGQFGQIIGTVYLSLPAGTKLPIHLAMTVPVSQTIPVDLNVAVNIPLSETQLGPEFQRFQALFRPLNDAVDQMPTTWQGVVECSQRGGVLINCKEK